MSLFDFMKRGKNEKPNKNNQNNSANTNRSKRKYFENVDYDDKDYIFRNLKSNKYSKMFDKNNRNGFAKFNASFGKYVKKDAEFWNKVYNNKITTGNNKAAKLRVEFKNAYQDSKDAEQAKQKRKDLVPQIIREEKQNPTPSPSIENFFKDIYKLKPNGKLAINYNLNENTFSGYDSYLLKQFLLSDRKANKEHFSKNIENKLDELQNQEIFWLSKDFPNKLGGGACHTVYKANVMQGNQEKEYVWKSIATNSDKPKVGIGSYLAGITGIDRKEYKAKLAERSILTKTLDTCLFPNNSVCSDTKAANVSPGFFEGKNNSSVSGIVMDLAQGEVIALRRLDFNLSKGPKDANNIKSFEELSRYVSGLGTIDEFIKLAASKDGLSKQYPNLEVYKTRNHIKILDIKKEINDKNVLQKALEGTIRLGILDYISGQIDRHHHNYYVDDQGNVTAIDNDASFGGKAGARGQKSKFFLPNRGSLLVNLPKVITNTVKDELKSFFEGDSYDNFLSNVEATFNKKSKEYIGVIKRIEDVKKLIGFEKGKTYAEKATAKVVDDLLSDESVQLLDSDTNYLVRDLLVRHIDAKGINKFSYNEFRANNKPRLLEVKRSVDGDDNKVSIGRRK